MLDTGNRALIGHLRKLDHGLPIAILVRSRRRELVDAAKRRLRVTGRELGAHPKGVDGSTLRKERLDGVLVEVVRGRDPHVRQARLVKGPARLLGELGKVTRVDADRCEALSYLLHLLGDGYGISDALMHVIGVNEKDAVLGTRPSEGAKGVELRREGHDPGVGMRAEDGYAIDLTGKNVRGGACAADVGGAGHRETTIGTLRAPETEVGDGVSLCGMNDARCLGGNKRLEVHEVQKRRLKELAVDEWPLNAYHGLARKGEVTLWDGPDAHPHTKVAQVVEEAPLEHGATTRGHDARKIVDGTLVEHEVLDEIGNLAYAAGDGIAPLKGTLAKEDREAALCLTHARLPEALRHRQLVQVRVERYVARHGCVGQCHGCASPQFSVFGAPADSRRTL